MQRMSLDEARDTVRKHDNGEKAEYLNWTRSIP